MKTIVSMTLSASLLLLVIGCAKQPMGSTYEELNTQTQALRDDCEEMQRVREDETLDTDDFTASWWGRYQSLIAQLDQYIETPIGEDVMYTRYGAKRVKYKLPEDQAAIHRQMAKDLKSRLSLSRQTCGE